jgi:tRNA A58 N-methylase Trm61
MAEKPESHCTSHSADSCGSAFFCEEGPHTQHLQSLVKKRVQVVGDNDKLETTATSAGSQRRILDIGGGTGNFTRMLLEKENKNAVNLQAVVVDPFLEQSSSEACNLKFVKAHAKAFLTSAAPNDWWRRDFHQVLT